MLRDYQHRAVDDVRGEFQSGKRAVLLVSPTGSGKTVVFCHIARATAARNKRVMILVHRQELIDQCSRTLTENGVEHGLIAAGRNMNQMHTVQVASVQTLARRLSDTVAPDLIVCDEAHHSCSKTWKDTLSHFSSARVLGVTATPERLDKRGLGEVFNSLVMGPSPAFLISQGYLSRPVYFAPPGLVDTSAIRTTAGDFNRHDTAEAMDKPKITGDAVAHYGKLCPGVPAICFCITIEHARHVAAEFRNAGWRADTIDGSLSDFDRRDRVAALADGRLHVLTSCEIVSEGFDLPVAVAAILLRPTKSLGLHLQQVGRVLRPVYAPGQALDTPDDRLSAMRAGPKPQAIILDHVGNLHRHGLAEDEREWTLEGETRRAKKDDGLLPLTNKQCPKCYAMHAPAPSCPHCGEVYDTKRMIQQVAGELVPLNASAIVRADAWAQCPHCARVHRADLGKCPACNKDHAKERRVEVGRADTLESLIAVGRSRGYKNPAFWARHILKARGNRVKLTS